MKATSADLPEAKNLILNALLLLTIVFLPLYAIAQERVLFYHNDALGSPVAMTDANGTVVWQADYEPFGNTASLMEATPNTHRFIGKEIDLETSLHYFGVRFYDGGIGRFLSTDPALQNGIPLDVITTPQVLNIYAYSVNNPYRFIDPDGEIVISLIRAILSKLAQQAAKQEAKQASKEAAEQAVKKSAGEIGKKSVLRDRINVSEEEIERTVKSSRRTVKGKEPRGRQKLQRRIDKTPEFRDLEKSQETAEEEIRRILRSNPEESFDSAGQRILRDPSTGKAIRFDKNGDFDTFLGP